MFGGGAPGAPAVRDLEAPRSTRAATAEPVTYSFGPAQAADALQLSTTSPGGAVAVLLQVTSLAQGHRGLGYTVAVSGLWRCVRGLPPDHAHPGGERRGLHDEHPPGRPRCCGLVPPGLARTRRAPRRLPRVCRAWSRATSPTRWTHSEHRERDRHPLPRSAPAPCRRAAPGRRRPIRTFTPASNSTHSVTFTFTTFRPGVHPLRRGRACASGCPGGSRSSLRCPSAGPAFADIAPPDGPAGYLRTQWAGDTVNVSLGRPAVRDDDRQLRGAARGEPGRPCGAHPVRDQRGAVDRQAPRVDHRRAPLRPCLPVRAVRRRDARLVGPVGGG